MAANVVKISKYAVLVVQNVYNLLQVGTTDNYVVTARKQMYVLVQKTYINQDGGITNINGRY